MNELQEIIDRLCAAATELSVKLELLGKEIGPACGKPVNAMSIGEKIKLAELLIAAHKKLVK